MVSLPTAPEGYTFSIRQPDDFHVHFRDSALTPLVVSHTARQFARAIAMPNLVPPVTTTAMAQAYREKLLAAQPEGSSFEPLMTLYLTDDTSPEEIRRAKDSGIVHAVKLYPAHATTNSHFGVTSIEKVMPVLAEMEKVGMPFLMHGEVNDSEIDIFDREKYFIEQISQFLVKRFPGLRMVQEHITTQEMADFVLTAPANVAATITPQHLLYNRNALFVGGVRPHHYCLPVLKREKHREALMKAVLSGNTKFFAGTDSAPHPKHTKEAACGCAGIYSAYCAVELYAEAFDTFGGGLHTQKTAQIFEAFMSENGARFYHLPLNQNKITLKKESLEIPASFGYPEGEIIPLRAFQTVAWKMIHSL